MFSCDWCGKSIKRAWQIPKSSDRRAQWVCRECHDGYFRGDLDDQGRDDDTDYRVI